MVSRKQQKKKKKLMNEDDDQQQDEEDIEEKPKKGKNGKATVHYKLDALPSEPVEIRCSACNHKGITVIRKSCGDRGKIMIFYGAVTLFIAMFFVFILGYMILHMIICSEEKCKGCNCCSCKGMY